jgi:hypothetical protein
MFFARITAMKRCHHCGNSYEKCFELSIDGKSYAFDSFECAIQVCAPLCANCGCRILGHGMEADHVIYCCAHCAREMGVKSLVDNS